jgi:hypothetical protein
LRERIAESEQRMGRSQRDHSVAPGAEAVQPIGHPMSHSTNSGFKLRMTFEDPEPVEEVVGTGRER